MAKTVVQKSSIPTFGGLLDERDKQLLKPSDDGCCKATHFCASEVVSSNHEVISRNFSEDEDELISAQITYQVSEEK